MKYIKHFESQGESISEEMMRLKDDIAEVLTKYYYSHTGDLCEQIDEIIWSSGAGDEFGQTGQLTEEIVRQVVDELEGGWRSPIRKLLDVYYHCKEFVRLVDKNLNEDIREIFLEYSDQGEVKVSKTSKFNDDRYVVNLSMRDVFFKIDFQEVFNRIKDLGFDNYSVDGSKTQGREWMNLEFWRPKSKD